MPSKRISLLAFYHDKQNSGLSLIKTPNKMQIIISSTKLHLALGAFNLDIAPIESVSFKDGYFTLTSREKEVSMFAHSNLENAYINQSSRRWDHVKSLLKEVEEQLIVIDILDFKLEVKFQF